MMFKLISSPHDTHQSNLCKLPAKCGCYKTDWPRDEPCWKSTACHNQLYNSLQYHKLKQRSILAKKKEKKKTKEELKTKKMSKTGSFKTTDHLMKKEY